MAGLSDNGLIFLLESGGAGPGRADGAGVLRRARFAVGVAGGLLRQLHHYVQRVEHQLHHVNRRTAYPHHGRNDFLPGARDALPQLTYLLHETAACLQTGVFCHAGDQVAAAGNLLYGPGHQAGGPQHGDFIRRLHRGFARDQRAGLLVGSNMATHGGLAARLVRLPFPVTRHSNAL